MPEVQDLTLSDLNERRTGILEHLGMTYEDSPARLPPGH